MKLSIPDMTCGHCKATVERAICELDAGAQVAVDLGTRTAEIGTTAEVAKVQAALKAAGYDSVPA